MDSNEIIGIVLLIVGAFSFLFVQVHISCVILVLGLYLLYRGQKKPESTIDKDLRAKNEELKNIEMKLAKMEKEKEEEINQKLADRQSKLDNIEEELDKLESERIREVDEKIKDKIEELDSLNAKYEKLELEKKDDLSNKLKFNQDRLIHLQNEVSELESQLDNTKEELEMQSYGLYEPRYKFVNSTLYKEKLTEIRKKQKQLIKDKTAAQCFTEWTVDGSVSKGRAKTNANIRQILRSFNNECEVIINKVKHSNFESSEKRIQKSFDSLNNLYKRDDVVISQQYLNLKFDEFT
ncbi:DUF4041 domain-containing protein [uncultured Methanobrevibacter sp.]|uniref:DUF4041 domain-containing protein n=1 Tax=uncultured Methanobrevibacter sp. TaxID=253161 RepID=UPI00261C7790|nr:DUF4041 domain-containing protein [uncultured Methanobrevibacter sp.]